MRITHQILMKVARDAIEEMARRDHTLLAVYLSGSLNSEKDPALGGAADVDLVVIHQIPPETGREFRRLTDDYHLDITRLDRRTFDTPRQLRTHPWLGPAIYQFKIMHDPSHFLDFVQAGVRDRFNRPSNVLQRAFAFAQEARRAWVELSESDRPVDSQGVLSFLEAAASGLNAIASLSGRPIPERRLLQDYYHLADSLGAPELYRDLVALLGGADISLEDLRGWLPVWGETFTAAAPHAAPESGIHPDRFSYYRLAFQAILETERPSDLLWTLLHSWCLAVLAIPQQPRLGTAWEQAFEALGLRGAAFAERLSALDAYLDTVEERLDAWGNARGVGVYE